MNEKQKLGQEPAFPVLDDVGVASEGMSKRLYIATAAMQGMLASGRVSTDGSITWVTHMSYKYADELLKQENK